MKTLISPKEPGPVGTHNLTADASPWIFLCEHACNRIPLSLDRLGLPDSQINRHIGWDIGILDLTKQIVDRLNTLLIFQQYSRLVIDCNRPLESPDLIPECSENTHIPGNMGLDNHDRKQRIDDIWAPYQQYIKNYFDQVKQTRKMVVSMHSFTPVFKGKQRPWHVGLLFNRDPEMAIALNDTLQKKDPSLNIGMNQPYNVSDDEDYTLPTFGEAMGLPHVLIEIRQDLISSPEDSVKWTELFVSAFRDLEKNFIQGII